MHARIYNEKSRDQIWNEFNRKYTQLYGKDLFGNPPHPKAKKVESTTEIRRMEVPIAQKEIKSNDIETIPKQNKSVLEYISDFNRAILQLPITLILWPFRLLHKLWLKISTPRDKKTKSKSKDVKAKHSYSGSYNK
jgi:hypothetical protein